MSDEVVLVTVIDAQTDEIVTRPMNEQELADYKALQAEHARIAEQEKARQLARDNALAKLQKLGLTEEEVKSLL